MQREKGPSPMCQSPAPLRCFSERGEGCSQGHSHLLGSGRVPGASPSCVHTAEGWTEEQVQGGEEQQ